MVVVLLWLPEVVVSVVSSDVLMCVGFVNVCLFYFFTHHTPSLTHRVGGHFPGEIVQPDSPQVSFPIFRPHRS